MVAPPSPVPEQDKDGGGAQQQVYIDPITGQAIAFEGKEPPLPLPSGASWVEVRDGVWQVKVSGAGDGGATSGGGGGGFTVSGGGVSGPSDAEVREQRMVSTLEQVYMDIWGELPPVGYAKRFAGEMNVFEFADMERHKPAYLRTEHAQDKADSLVSFLKSLGAI